jgi:hypothetical protein
MKSLSVFLPPGFPIRNRRVQGSIDRIPGKRFLFSVGLLKIDIYSHEVCRHQLAKTEWSPPRVKQKDLSLVI